MQCSIAAFSPRVSLVAAHEYVRVPADMHPRLLRVTSSNIGNTGLNSPAGRGGFTHYCPPSTQDMIS